MNMGVKARALLSLAILALLLTSCARFERVSNTQVAASQNRLSQPCLNLNKASAEELMQLPGIGEVTARRITEHRERNGAFRRKEEIIIVDGFSERKYREIADMICVE
jgi:competence ComEA-like helix-hairpin-helix protein